MKKVYYIVISLLILAAPMVAGQVVYDSVRRSRSSPAYDVSEWVDGFGRKQSPSPTLYTVRAPAIIGGRGFRVTLRFADAVWPSAAANKSSGGRVGGAGDPSWLDRRRSTTATCCHDRKPNGKGSTPSSAV